MEPRVAAGTHKPIQVGDRYQSYSINLNHNMLTGPLETFPSLLQKILIMPEALTSLDLSFNVFTEIPKVQFSKPSIPIGEMELIDVSCGFIFIENRDRMII